MDATSAADALEYFGGLAGSLTGEHIPMGRKLGLHNPRAIGALRWDWGMELSNTNFLLEGRACACMRKRHDF